MAAMGVMGPLPLAWGFAASVLTASFAGASCSRVQDGADGREGESDASTVSAAISRNLSTPELRPADLEGDAFRVMTFNLRYDTPDDGDHRWSMRRERVAHVIRESGAAIIGTQEGLVHQIEWLDEALPNHLHLGVGRDDGMSKGEYTAILIDTTRFDILESGTFWLSDTPDSPSVGWDAALPRICSFAVLVPAGQGRRDGGGDGGRDAGGGADGGDGEVGADGGDGADREDGADGGDADTSEDLTLESWFDLKADDADFAGLDSGFPFADGAFIVMNAHYDHMGAEARANSSRLILRIMDEIGRTLPVILLGDFNAEPGSEPIATLQEELADAFDAPGIRREGSFGTFNGFENRESYDARIDYVFHSPELSPLTHLVFDRRIEGLFPSDHFPVIVDLRWNR